MAKNNRMESKTQRSSRQVIELDTNYLESTTGAAVERIKGVVVFTVDNSNKDSSIKAIASVYGDQTLFRIINPIFIDDALEHGTDRADIDSSDFRRLFPWSGLDVWQVEKKATRMGVKKSDVIFADPYKLVIKETSLFDGEGWPTPEIDLRFLYMILGN